MTHARFAALLFLPALFLPALALAAPQDVSLSVEPISSAPPLYLGQPLLALNGVARVVAVANLRAGGGAAQNPSALDYEWTVDGTRVANVSGIGKSSIRVTAPLQYRSENVSVTVSTADGSVAGTASVDLSASDPVVRLYENDPLLGIRFDHALGDAYAITGSEVSLYGAAFSLPVDAALPDFTWFLNGASAGSGSVITLRPTGQGQGSATISFVASEGDAKAAAPLSLSFGQQNTNLLGL